MYASRASPWPLNQQVWISRCGTCFLAGRSCICNKRSVKSVRRKAKHTNYIERVRECERVFEPHRTWRHGRLSRRPRALFASLGAADLSCTHRSQRGLHGIEAEFTLCLLFRFRARLLALPSSLPLQLWPFWHCDNETASAATVLRTLNLHTVYTFCKQDVLITFINETDVCTQATSLIAFVSMTNCIPEAWHHTPPTEKTHCKISSLVPRHSAIIESLYIVCLGMCMFPLDWIVCVIYKTWQQSLCNLFVITHFLLSTWHYYSAEGEETGYRIESSM